MITITCNSTDKNNNNNNNNNNIRNQFSLTLGFGTTPSEGCICTTLHTKVPYLLPYLAKWIKSGPAAKEKSGKEGKREKVGCFTRHSVFSD